jgi:hypothetical protein
VFERPLRYLSIALTLVVTAGFTLFALDDFDRASDSSVDRIAGYTATDPTPSGERERERRHSKARELIDDVNDVLLRPFAGLTESADSRWVRRGIPALFGLLVYGFLIAYFARYSKGHG